MTADEVKKLLKSRTSHGVRGLKYVDVRIQEVAESRTSHGVRGLKYK